MKILNLIRVQVSLGYYRWALREIPPLHPAVPMIVQRQRTLEDQLKELYA
jgi:hypothetical protein